MSQGNKYSDVFDCSREQDNPGKETSFDGILTSSEPCRDRSETNTIITEVCSGRRPSRVGNVHGGGPMLVSDIPRISHEREGVILGIDEAGRGPVLGPMTYAAAYWYPSQSKSIPKGFADSKQLSASTRSKLFSDIQSNPHIGFVLRMIHATEISRNMLRADPYNLNSMSHNAAIQMIQAVLDAGVKIDTCFVDTVGTADTYKLKLEREFEAYSVKFVVEKKADAKYPPCSAASVVAKVTRDSMIDSWNWTETAFEPVNGRNYGSGYPSDPKCKAWLEKNFSDPIFCFPDFIRFSWNPVKTLIKEHGTKVEWEAEEDEEEMGTGNRQDQNQISMNSFLLPSKKRNAQLQESGKQTQKKKQRYRYFDRMKLNAITKII